jgi:hypothetical protein
MLKLNLLKHISPVFIFVSLFLHSQHIHTQSIKASENSHYLVDAQGKPFFYLADTGWKLFQQCTREEAETYLENRKQLGFNVIQATAIIDIVGLEEPNRYGDLPLHDKNPTKPAITEGNNPDHEKEYDYWDHMDWIIDLAAEKGLYIGLVAVWGEYVTPRYSSDNLIFKTTEQAYSYGYFLGNRYKARKNIIWILGGDRHPDEHASGIFIWRAMAEGIADGTNGIQNQDDNADYTTTCMTYHAYDSSSHWFHNDEWIDFHMWGSYHSDFYLQRAYMQAENDWNLPNPKPTINGEPAYEEHPVNWLNANGIFLEYDIRQIAYWSVFAGACGHTYGAHPIWQFYDIEKKPESPTYSTWKEALHFPGARQIQHLKHLIESRPMLERIPDQSLITSGQGTGSNHVRATRGNDYAFIYIPTGSEITIQMGKISGETVTAWWYNPRRGESVKIGDFPNHGLQKFDPPGISKEMPRVQTGRGCDWILVLDNKTATYPPPGTPSL